MEGSLTAAEIERWRSRFPILDRCTYLISNSLGAMPTGVRDELTRFSDTWEQRGVRAWHEGWWELAVDTGDLLAPVLGVGAQQTTMHLNVSLALTVFLSCFDFPASRNRIVLSELDFPSLMYVAHGQRRRGAEIRTIPSPDGIGIDADSLLAAVDDRTRLVLISHVLFKSGFALDVAAIARRCREVGALLVLDVYQSAGVMPLALAEWGVHAAVGGTLKWLCGGPGVSFLWVHPELASNLEPMVTGWQADEDPFSFRASAIRYAGTAWRFLTGTPNVPGLYSCRPGCRIVSEVGVERIRARSLELTDRLIQRADDAGFEVRTPRSPVHRGGTVTVWHPRSERLCGELVERAILCDFRPGGGIRLSPHFYNTVDECDLAIATLAELAHR